MPSHTSFSFAIVAATFHKETVEKMIQASTEELSLQRHTLHSLTHVPGCFELPLAVKKILEKDGVDGVIVLGAIERGETLHGEVMGNQVYRALIKLELSSEKPLGMGIIGPGATHDQILERAIPAAKNAVRAAISLLTTIKSLG